MIEVVFAIHENDVLVRTERFRSNPERAPFTIGRVMDAVESFDTRFEQNAPKFDAIVTVTSDWVILESTNVSMPFQIGNWLFRAGSRLNRSSLRSGLAVVMGKHRLDVEITGLT